MAEEITRRGEGGYSSKEKFATYKKVAKLAEVFKYAENGEKAIYETTIDWGRSRAIFRAFTIETETARENLYGVRIVLLTIRPGGATNILNVPLYPRTVDTNKLETLIKLLSKVLEIAKQVNYFKPEEKISEDIEL